MNYPESLSTLYFADSAKRVKNRAVINEDPNVKLIKDLKSEIDNLRKFIYVNQLQGDDSFLQEHERMKANLVEKEGKINDLQKAWTEKWQETKKVIEENQLAITSEGLKLYLGSLLPHLIELDPRSSQPSLVMYHLKKGVINVGKSTPEGFTDIELDGEDIVNEHCQLEYEDEIRLIPRAGNCAVNNKHVTESVKLHHGDMLRFGKCVLKFFNPQHKHSTPDQSMIDEVSDADDSLLSNSPQNTEICDLNQEADITLDHLNEDKDREIDRLTQQVKDLKEASARMIDRMACIPDDISREMSMEDDVFTNSVREDILLSLGTEEQDRNFDLERFDGGAVMSQTYAGSLGTSPFHRMSVLSLSGEDDVGMLTENEFGTMSPCPDREKKALSKQPSYYFPGSPSTSSDDVNTPVDTRSQLTFSSMPPEMKRVSMMDVEKMIHHEKKKLRLKHEGELFKLQKEKETMLKQISLMQKDRANHVTKSRVRLNSRAGEHTASPFEQIIINASIPYTHLVRKSFFSGTFHIYHVQVEVREKGVINVYRRYNEFRNLKDYVNLQYPELEELFEYPPRRFIGNKAPAFVAQRQILLEVYLRKVMTFLSCKNACPISCTSGDLPTKEAVMAYHAFFQEDETDRELYQDSVPIHHID